ncbi:MAG: ATP-dependent DNA ligase [Candidatus Aenigmarchaeota archaeon]|nr:ATP-dependent DNA ligase [Candidatus Aenigmarchaeota archaeon]
MDYSLLTDYYEKLEAVSSKLKKTEILSELFKKTPTGELGDAVLLLSGRVFPSFSQLELGVAKQMMIKAISKASGFSQDEVEEKFKKTGDLGLAAEQCFGSRKQTTLLKKKLTISSVFENLKKLPFISGEGSQEKKLQLISELLVSSKAKEAKYIVRTVLGELRVGVAEGLIRDAIVSAFLLEKGMPKEKKNEITDVVDYSWNLLSDYGQIAVIAKEKGIEGLKKVKVQLGNPIQVMLAEKAESIKEVIEKYGKIAIETKYDGMRAQIHKKKNQIWVYTRRLEDVTKQFPDLVELCQKSLKADECIVEGEVLAIDKKTNTPMPFQMLSQRVQRKYDIDEMSKQIPIQMNLFDILYLDGKMLFDKPLIERRKILEKQVKIIPKKFQLAKNLVTDDLKKAEKFYKEALAERQEGAMIKVLNSQYVFGRHVDGWIKIKPVMETLDLVVVGATWGEGTRANWLTSYLLACRDAKSGKLLEVGMMSTGLSEEEYKMMTSALKPLVREEKGRTVKVSPKIVIEVKYQEIQKSPTYESGFALRFPALGKIRFDKGLEDVDTIERVKKLYESQGRAG